MGNTISFVIRIVFSIFLLIGTFRETGHYTTATLALVLISIETTSFYLKSITRRIQQTDQLLDESTEGILKIIESKNR